MSAGVAAFEYELPLAETLARVRRLGATRCELLVPGDVTPGSSAAAAEAVAAAGVQVTAVVSRSTPNAPGGEAEGLRLLEHSVDCAAALGAPFAIGYFGAHPSRAPGEAIRRYAELTRPCLARAAELGVTVLVENHFSHAPGDPTSAPDGCAELMGTVGLPSFGLNFDPCNFAIAGVDLMAAYVQLRDVIRNVHVKDTRSYDARRDAGHQGLVVRDVRRGPFLFVPLGEGMSDNDAVLDALAADGYRGPITVEAHTPPDTLDAAFAHGLRYCRERGW